MYCTQNRTRWSYDITLQKLKKIDWLDRLLKLGQCQCSKLLIVIVYVYVCSPSVL